MTLLVRAVPVVRCPCLATRGLPLVRHTQPHAELPETSAKGVSYGITCGEDFDH